MIRGALDAYEPNWRRRLLKYGVKKALKVAGEYAAWSKILRKPYKTHTEIASEDKKSFDSSMPPKTRARSFLAKASGKRKLRRAMTKLSAVNRFKKAGAVFAAKSAAAAAAKAKPSFVPTHTAGYVGKFAGKKKKQTRRAASKFDTQGVVIKNEHSFVRTGTECIYVGHGTPINYAFSSAVYAVVRSLFHKAGYDIDDWRSNAQLENFTIIMKYTLSGNPQQNELSISFTNTAQWTQIAGGVVAQIRTNITNPKFTIQWQTIELITQRAVLIGEEIVNRNLKLAQINLEEYYLVYDYWSILKIKNVSLAEDGTDGDLITNVEAQPLVGRSYTTTKWANGFFLTKRFRSVGSDVGNASIVVGDNNGTISTDSSVIWGENDNANPYHKPLPAYAFGQGIKTAVARLNPGELKTDTHKWTARMSFNVMSQKLIFNADTDDDDGNLRLFGKTSMYALEREVEIGTATKPVRVACEVVFILKCRGYQLAHKVLPLQLVRQ